MISSRQVAADSLSPTSIGCAVVLRRFWRRVEYIWPARIKSRDIGEVAEWPNVPDSKSGVAQVTVGSNPTLSAKMI